MYKLNNNIKKSKIGVSHNSTGFFVKIVINKFFFGLYIFFHLTYQLQKIKFVKSLMIKCFKIKKY